MATIGKKVAGQEAHALAAAKRYTELAEDIRWFSQAIPRAMDGLGRVDVCSIPESYALVLGKDGLISHNRKEQALIAAWLEKMPATRISVFRREDGSSCLGYSVAAERGRALGLDQTPGVAYIPSQAALHTSVLVPSTFFDHPEMAFVPLDAFLTEHGFQPQGQPLAVSLAVQCKNERRDILLEAWMPFR